MSRPIVEAGLFIEQAIEAIGGQNRLTNIFSLYTELERNSWLAEAEPGTMRVDVYRAQGGRIRYEEYQSATARTVTILNGLSGVRQLEQLRNQRFRVESREELHALDVEQIKRSVRLYPRNFLAHADEHQYNFLGLQMIEGEQVYALELLVEAVSYHFDPTTLLCLRMIDRRSDSVITYEDYRAVAEIQTPFIERLVQAKRSFRVDTIKTLQYNLELADELFDVI